MPAPLIAVEGVTKSYGTVRAVDDVSLNIQGGEFFALLGPSGCGKTTLMRMIAGFETPDAGRILLDGRDLAGDPPNRRPINMMFQSYALFPHMSVEKNIAFPLRRQGMGGADVAQRVAEMLRLVQLESLGARRPDQLSGGQKARVALARALAGRPRLLLLDEPLSALDRKLREETRFELAQVQRELGVAFLVVTHDQDEAMAMAQRVAVMRAGRIEQLGAPRAVYERPASRWLAAFLGDANLIDGVVEGSTPQGSRTVAVRAGETLLSASVDTDAAPLQGGQAVSVAIRAERIGLSVDPPMQDNIFCGEVRDIAYLGGSSVYRIACDGDVSVRAARMESADAAPLQRGDRVFVSWPASSARVLAR